MSWNSSVSTAKDYIEGDKFLEHLNKREHLALDIVSAPCQIYNGTPKSFVRSRMHKISIIQAIEKKKQF